MQGGFSFCGQDIAFFGVEYVPPLTETYVYGNNGYQINEQTFEGHHGGIFYGATIPPKTFSLRCMFEETNIIKGVVARIESFFYPGRTGRLVFAKRDWLYYIATVVSVEKPELTNKENGFITITMKAYYPFGRTDKNYLESDGMYDDFIAGNSGILEEELTPKTEFTYDEYNGTLAHSFLLYNGGSCRAHVAVKISGNAGDGVVIKNNTNNTEVKFILFDKNITTNANKYIICDAINQKTVLTDGTHGDMAFIYHDHGFLSLEPSFPIHRDVFVETKYGSDQISGFNLFNESTLGHYVYLEGKWHKIISLLDDSSAIIDEPLTTTDFAKTQIVRMNEITVQPLAQAQIDSLGFIYKPTFI